MADKVFIARNGIVANGAFTANSTVVNAAAIAATSVDTPTLKISGVLVGTLITSNATTAYANAAAYADVQANAAYTNAVALSGNATNLTTGTLPNARLSSAIVNTSASFTIAGQFTFSNNTNYSNTITANGSTGTAGQVLTSSGATGNVYWSSAAAGANMNASYSWTNTHVFSNTVNVNNSTLSVGSTTVNTAITLGTITLSNSAVVATINSTFYSGLSNNSTYLNGQLASYYQTANNITFGTLPIGRLGTSGTPSSANYLRGDYSWSTVQIAASDVTSGTMATARLGSGTADATTYLRGDQTWSSLNASHLTSGTVATARLATTGTANSTTYLRGDQTWATVASSGGTVTQVSTGTGLTGGPITTSGTISLATAGAGAATYSSGISSITVDAYGRVTSVSGSASYATQTYVTSQGYITSSALSSYVAKAGDTMTGRLVTSNSGSSSSDVTRGIYLPPGGGIRVAQDTTHTPGYGSNTVGGAWQSGTDGLGATLYLSRAQFATMRLNQNTSNDNYIDFNYQGTAIGSIYHNSGTGGASFSGTLSDYRYKTDIQLVDNALQLVISTPVYSYRWKNNPEDSSRYVGFLAHEAQQVVPVAVRGEKDAEEPQRMDLSQMVPTLWAAVRELSLRVESLEAQLNAKS